MRISKRSKQMRSRIYYFTAIGLISGFKASNEMKVQEEYLVYNEVDLVGIVGGNLGLFVGFSFFEKVKQVINFIIDKI